MGYFVSMPAFDSLFLSRFYFLRLFRLAVNFGLDILCLYTRLELLHDICLGADNHTHVSPFALGRLVDHRNIRDVFGHPFEKILSSIVREWHTDETILLSTHEVAEAEGLFERTVFLRDGRLALDAQTEDLRMQGKSVVETFKEVLA